MELMAKEIHALKKNTLIWTRADLEKLVADASSHALGESAWQQITSLTGIRLAEDIENAIEVDAATFLKIVAFENACQLIKKIQPTHKV